MALPPACTSEVLVSVDEVDSIFQHLTFVDITAALAVCKHWQDASQRTARSSEWQMTHPPHWQALLLATPPMDQALATRASVERWLTAFPSEATATLTVRELQLLGANQILLMRRLDAHRFEGVEFSIAGLTHYRPAIAAAATVLRAGGPSVATLEAEPTNAHDPNAMKVLVAGHHVGYVPRCVVTRLLLCPGGPVRLLDSHKDQFAQPWPGPWKLLMAHEEREERDQTASGPRRALS
jgi:hypothetical protein